MAELTRTSGGHFVPGHGIKSPGRPRGPSASEMIREMLLPHQPELVAKVVELAKLGDPAALKLCLERLAPTPRQEAEKIIIPGLAHAPTIQGKCDSILAAVADGHISTEAGERALRMISTYLAAAVATDHEARLAALEDGKTRLAVLEAAQKAQLKDASPAIEDADFCDLV